MPTILAIDDDPSFLDILRVFVDKLGYEFLSAEDGIMATKVVQRKRPDLIIADYNMPAADGVTVVDRISKLLNNPDIPVIFISGDAIEEAIKGAQDMPHKRFLTKPIKLFVLEAAIRELLQEPPPGRRQEEPEEGSPSGTVIDLDDPKP